MQSTNFILIQSIGFVALLLFALSFQLKTKQKILGVQVFSFLFWSLHYALLGAWTGMALTLLNSLRVFTFYKYKGRPRWLLYIFLFLALLFTVITWEGYISLFVLGGVFFATISTFQEDEQKLRHLFPPSNIMWIVYNLFVRSYSGILSEIIVLISIIVGIFRNKNTRGRCKI